jgi:general secretion pathway protein G
MTYNTKITHHNHRPKARHAFTLIEIILVIALLGILTSALAVALVKSGNRAKIDLTYTGMNTIKQQLDAYNIRNGKYPTTVDGLRVLVPNYVPQKSLNDPWKNPYAYYSPVQGIAEGFDLRSNGPDGLAQTQDDISIWDAQ